MSRCFPFPPPGYEKKPTTDGPDLLKKEKLKEKKHKKDKKDKEKKDGKEKKEKDRSEGKHKEKKDKKDKHRDKKDKERSKSSTPDEKKIYGQFEGRNGEKLHYNNEDNKDKTSSSNDQKESLQFLNGNDKRSLIQYPRQNGELVQNRSRVGDPDKFVQELDRRIRDEEKGTGSHQFVGEGRKIGADNAEIQKMGKRQSLVNGVVGFGRNPMVQNKINGSTPPLLDNRRIEQKEKMQDKESDDKRGDKRKHKDRDKHREGKGKDTAKQKKDEKSKEKSEKKKVERDKNKHIKKSGSVAVPNCLSAHPLENGFQGVGSERNLKKRKDMETNGIFHENESRPNKMARHISNISPENGRINFPQSPGSSLLDKQVTSQGLSPNSFKVGSKGQKVNGMIASQPILVSAKKPPISAFNHVRSKTSLIKSPPVITNHVAAQSPPVPSTEPQHNHIAAQQFTPKPPPSVANPIAQQPVLLSTAPVSRPKPPPAVVNKVAVAAAPAVNKVTAPPLPPPGIFNKVAAPPLPIPKKKPPVAVEPPKKQPHPDTKYLNRILSVPKPDQWCGLDDQEWLFNKKEGLTSKKLLTEELHVQVWSAAKHLESVDVCALPYVIPY